MLKPDKKDIKEETKNRKLSCTHRLIVKVPMLPRV